MLGLIVLAVFGIYAWLVVLVTRWAMRRAAASCHAVAASAAGMLPCGAAVRSANL